MKFSLIAAAAAICSPAVATPTKASAGLVPRQASSSLPVITQRGNAFWEGDKRFYLRGVAYQPGGEANAADPIIDTKSLARDIEQFKKLGINSVRVYTIDNSQDHTEGMQMLADAGIYLVLDCNTPKYSLNRENAEQLHLSYNDKYLQNVFATMDAFAGFSNTLLFIAGNEVINDPTNTNAAPYVKAVVRDMKTYIANRGMRSIPVGYAAADVAENVESQLRYMDCGPDIARTDFFGMNDYSWCDPSSYNQSGWAAKVEKYSDYGSPLFLAEYGCIKNTREWEEVKSIYSEPMTGTYSGGLAYEYALGENGYGFVKIDADGDIVPDDDFERLADMLNSTPDPEGDGGARPSASASECPEFSDQWNVPNMTLPAPPGSISRFMDDGAGTGVGLGGDDSSQWGGSSSDLDNYSESWIEMDGSVPTGTPNNDNTGSGSGNGNSNGGFSSGGSSGGNDGNDASIVHIASVMAAVVGGSLLGAFLL